MRRDQLLAELDRIEAERETTDLQHQARDHNDEGLPKDALEDAVDVAAEGREIARVGVPYLWHGVIAALGMLGFLVAYAKVGKTTFGQILSAHIAGSLQFLDRAVTGAKVLILACEDPPEYTAYLARNLPDVSRGRLIFFRRPLVLDEPSLRAVVATVKREGVGLVLIASWQAVVRGLIRDENDNAGAVQVVERVKLAARETGIPWLIDAHSGKGEDQAEDADPSRAMRGASGAAGAADYTLSLRYANGAFGTQRRLSGKGRFVSFPPITLDFDQETSVYTVVSTKKDVGVETTWRLICETGALTDTPRSSAEIAEAAGLLRPGERLGGAARKRIADALYSQPDVLRVDEMRHGKKVTRFYRGTP